ncbi:isochorismatase family protein [Thermomonospora umbrina]|uniref:Nicotinamidase-related amidase n=1 Tax=Thermomonospora umbrina TaxID=111806 RepID=A0A3D9SYI8_9ACTN|nr:isochorismatase family protein [Thermomonospora umbrina]REE98055.1 nicotinamidase-related amidase [Thermomonospora umbrina]
MTEIVIDPSRSALVAIDLQLRIVGRHAEPHTGADVVRRSAQLAEAFRRTGALVVVVKREWPQDPQPAGSELVDEIAPRDDDLLVTRRGDDAFLDTDLSELLPGRGIETLVITGIDTAAVETTARTAREAGHRLFLPHDATAGENGDAHRLAVQGTLPELGTVCTTDDVLAALTP